METKREVQKVPFTVRGVWYRLINYKLERCRPNGNPLLHGKVYSSPFDFINDWRTQSFRLLRTILHFEYADNQFQKVSKLDSKFIDNMIYLLTISQSRNDYSNAWLEIFIQEKQFRKKQKK